MSQIVKLGYTEDLQKEKNGLPHWQVPHHAVTDIKPGPLHDLYMKYSIGVKVSYENSASWIQSTAAKCGTSEDIRSNMTFHEAISDMASIFGAPIFSGLVLLLLMIFLKGTDLQQRKRFKKLPYQVERHKLLLLRCTWLLAVDPMSIILAAYCM